MKKRTVLAVLLVLGNGTSIASAASGSAFGPAALALAGVVASHSRVLSFADRRVIAQLFAGKSISFPPGRKISINADSITCRVSNVDIISRSCELVFGDRKRALKGRQANELFATLLAAGVASVGAAGSIFEKVTTLICTIDPNEVQQKAGGGAQCVFETGQ
jgi:hypothetical protein